MLVMAVASQWLGRGWHARRPADSTVIGLGDRLVSGHVRPAGVPWVAAAGADRSRTRHQAGGGRVRPSPRPPPEDHHSDGSTKLPPREPLAGPIQAARDESSLPIPNEFSSRLPPRLLPNRHSAASVPMATA